MSKRRSDGARGLVGAAAMLACVLMTAGFTAAASPAPVQQASAPETSSANATPDFEREFEPEPSPPAEPTPAPPPTPAEEPASEPAEEPASEPAEEPASEPAEEPAEDVADPAASPEPPASPTPAASDEESAPDGGGTPGDPPPPDLSADGSVAAVGTPGSQTSPLNRGPSAGRAGAPPGSMSSLRSTVEPSEEAQVLSPMVAPKETPEGQLGRERRTDASDGASMAAGGSQPPEITLDLTRAERSPWMLLTLLGLLVAGGAGYTGWRELQIRRGVPPTDLWRL